MGATFSRGDSRMSKTDRKRGWPWWVPVWALAIPLFVGLVGGLLIGGLVFGEEGVDLGPVPIDLGGPSRYVALGDSYSAGEGLAPFEETTRDIDEGGDRCHRSLSFAYARLFEFVWPTTRNFRACSGAIVANVFDEVQEHSGVANDQGLQVEPGIAGEDVLLVTVTMGGNDVNFAKVLSFCFSQEPCPDLAYKDGMTLRDWAAARLEQLKTDLLGLYPRLRQAFPSARILVLGYPSLFPLKAPPLYKEHGVLCTALFRRWTLSEREAIRDWGFNLNRVIQEATQAANSDIEFIDIASYFAGHEPCSAGGEWVRFIGLINRAVRDGSFHPLREGQAMMARIVSCYLDIFTAADTPRTKTTKYAMTGCVGRETAEVVESTEATVPTAYSGATPA
jgi:hypothetical protein